MRARDPKIVALAARLLEEMLWLVSGLQDWINELQLRIRELASDLKQFHLDLKTQMSALSDLAQEVRLLRDSLQTAPCRRERDW
jgi:hypothetical protein